MLKFARFCKHILCSSTLWLTLQDCKSCIKCFLYLDDTFDLSLALEVGAGWSFDGLLLLQDSQLYDYDRKGCFTITPCKMYCMNLYVLRHGFVDQWCFEWPTFRHSWLQHEAGACRGRFLKLHQLNILNSYTYHNDVSILIQQGCLLLVFYELHSIHRSRWYTWPFELQNTWLLATKWLCELALVAERLWPAYDDICTQSTRGTENLQKSLPQRPANPQKMSAAGKISDYYSLVWQLRLL